MKLAQYGLVQVVVGHERCEMDKGEASAGECGIGTPLISYTITEDCFSWNIHHALYDGWSMLLIFECLVKCYRSETVPDAPPFMPS
jgi:hypothetical protein